jgi:hypothetical protein
MCASTFIVKNLHCGSLLHSLDGSDIKIQVGYWRLASIYLHAALLQVLRTHSPQITFNTAKLDTTSCAMLCSRTRTMNPFCSPSHYFTYSHSLTSLIVHPRTHAAIIRVHCSLGRQRESASPVRVACASGRTLGWSQCTGVFSNARAAQIPNRTHNIHHTAWSY